MKDKEKKILNKKPVKIIVVIISLLICFFGIIPLFINFLVNTTNPFGIGFINQENKETWINFFGSIIGGGLTLFGVWWSIKDQENKRKKDLAIQYRPIFTCSISKFDTNIYYIKITNVGRSEAEINSISIQNIDEDSFINFFVNNFEKIDILAASDSFECLMALENFKKNFINGSYKKKIVMHYRNPITNQKGIFEKYLVFKISKINNMPFSVILEEGSKHYII